MHIQNRRDSSKFKGCNPLQLLCNLTANFPAIAYFAYTYHGAHSATRLPDGQEAELFLSMLRIPNKK